MTYLRQPDDISDRSFQIITEEIDKLYPNYPFRSQLEEDIIKRVIHTSADFDYLHNLKFNQGAAQIIQEVITGGGYLITDTNMALAGINKQGLDHYGCHYDCFVNKEETRQLAKEEGITRSMAAIELASRLPNPKVFVIGNAPTAIYRLLELLDQGKIELAAIVGVPVGFVGAAEAKEALHTYDIPSIVALSRKGGSNIAAAIINAIQYNLTGLTHAKD